MEQALLGYLCPLEIGKTVLRPFCEIDAWGEGVIRPTCRVARSTCRVGVQIS